MKGFVIATIVETMKVVRRLYNKFQPNINTGHTQIMLLMWPTTFMNFQVKQHREGDGWR